MTETEPSPAAEPKEAPKPSRVPRWIAMGEQTAAAMEAALS